MPIMKSISRAQAYSALSTVLVCCSAVAAAGAKDRPHRSGIQRISARSEKLEICDASSILLEFPDWLTTVKSLDPAVIRVSAIRPNCLRVQRIASGKAILHVVDRSDHEYSVELNVRASMDNEE
jgi:hypothetical protein